MPAQFEGLRACEIGRLEVEGMNEQGEIHYAFGTAPALTRLPAMPSGGTRFD